MNEYQIKVCVNADCVAYGVSHSTNYVACEYCKRKLKLRNGIDEPVNVVNGEVKSYGYRRDRASAG